MLLSAAKLLYGFALMGLLFSYAIQTKISTTKRVENKISLEKFNKDRYVNDGT